MDIVKNLHKVRRTVASFTLATLIASFFAVGVAQAQTFPDVQPSDWFYSFVEDLTSLGIVDSSQPSYRPADNTNRAEAVKLAVEQAGIELENPDTPTFNDVSKSDWFYEYVETAAANGIVNGYRDATGQLTGFFGPGDPVTREQMAKIIVNAAPLTVNTSCGPTFPDVPVSAELYPHVETVYAYSIVDGNPDGTFAPTKNINRAEIAKMISNMANPVLRPCGGFNLDSAMSLSSTTVEVCYNGDYDEEGLDSANYTVMDVDGDELAVTDVEAVDSMCVMLTTDSQDEDKSYDVSVTGVMSTDGMELGGDETSFTGYSTKELGGGLTCEGSTSQPSGKTIPKGATGVEFMEFTCTANDDDVVFNGIRAHRFGAGDDNDFSGVYLYEEEERLTTSRSINSETQTANLTTNVVIAAGQTRTFSVRADLATTAAAADEHAFQIKNKDDVLSNASSVGGTYPIAGELFTLSGSTAGTVTISSNGSPADLTIGETGRIAQFQLELDGAEAAELAKIALNIRGTCDADDVNDLALYAQSTDEMLAEAASVGSQDLVTFNLGENPLLIEQGGNEVFYVEAKVTCRNNETVRTFLDESTDLTVTGVQFGTGLSVTKTAYDGTGTNYSEITVTGSDFTVAFDGPDTGDISVSRDDALCLDLTATNASGTELEVKDWEVTLAIQTAATAAGSLLDSSGSTTTANYTLVKLAEMNEDGTAGSAILGPSELSTSGSDTSQTIVLSGSYTFSSGESKRLGLFFDVANNTSMNGDQVRCTLIDLTTSGKDFVTDVNRDALGSESITPASDIVSNTHTITSSAVTFELASTPAARNLISGAKEVPLVGFTARAGSSQGITIKNLKVVGYVDCDTSGTFESDGTSAVADATCGDSVATVLKGSVANAGLYNDDGELASEVENIETDGSIVFNNLSIEVGKGETRTLTLKGDINNLAPYGTSNDRVKFGLPSTATDITAIDDSGQTVATASISTSGATNGTTADSGVIMTILASGSGSVTDLASTTSQIITEASKKELARWRFTSTDASANIKDFQLALSKAEAFSKLYIAELTGGSCGEPIGTGYTSGTSGVVTITDVAAGDGIAIPEGSSVTLCILADVNGVGTGGSEPTTGSNVSVALWNVTEVTSGGLNVSDKYVSDQSGSTTLDGALTAAATSVPLTLGTYTPAAGDVVVVNGEMMYVTIGGAEPITVTRGYAGTTAAAHSDGDEVGNSRLASKTTTAAPVVSTTSETCIDFGADITAQYETGDIINMTNTPTEFMLVIQVGGCGTTADVEDIEVVRGVLGTTAATHAVGSVVTRHHVHGSLFRLRDSKPVISLETLPAPFTLPGSSSHRVLGINITAEGGEGELVSFTSADGNAIQVTVAAKLADATIPTGVSCTLKDDANTYDTAVTDGLVDSTAGTDVLAFDFTDRSLTLSSGESITLYMECNLTGGTASGDNFTASLASAAATVQYSDGTATDINEGDFVVTSELTGQTFVNSS